MRKANVDSSEIEQAEKYEYNRQAKRNKAFGLMDIRDRGWAKIPTKNGVETVMLWHSAADLEELVPRRHIPEDMFALEVGGKFVLFNVEEFKQWLRWA